MESANDAGEGTFSVKGNLREACEIGRNERGFAPFGCEPELLFVVVVQTIVGLDDVQRKATSVLHAGSAKDRAKRARSAALLPDDLADVGRSYFEPKHRGVLIENYLDLDRRGVVDQGLSDLAHKSADLRDRV